MNECTISILAVDDDMGLCSLTKEFLETFGYFRVDMAYSVREAMVMLADHRYDAIVSDYQMPGEDGIYFLRELRAGEDHTPFILFTGKGREEIAIEAIDNGADAYVQKGAETRSVFSDLAHKIREAVAKVRAETALMESEARYRSLMDGSSVGIYLTDTNGGCIYSNRRWLEMTSQTKVDSRGNGWMTGMHPEDKKSFKINWDRSIESEGKHSFEYRYIGSDNRTKWIWGNAAPIKDADGSVTGYVSTNVDITERKRVEVELFEKERTLAKASNLAKVGYWIWKAEKGEIVSSEGLSQLLRIQIGTSIPHDIFFDMVHPDDRKAVIEALETTLKGKGDFNIEHRMVRPDGSIITVRDTVEITSASGNRPVFILGVVQDITEEWHLKRELLAIKECNRALVKARSEQELLDNVCRIVCEMAGYRMAWIGMVENDERRSIRPVAWNGYDQEYVTQIMATWGEDVRGCGPAGMSIKTGRTVFVQDFSNDASTGPWRELANRKGYRSTIAIPLMNSGVAFGSLMLYSDQINGFTAEEVSLLEEMAGDLAFGLVSLRAQTEIRKAERALRDNESHLRTLVHTIPDLIWSKDVDGVYLSCNSMFERLFGAREVDIIGKTDYDFVESDLADNFRENDLKAMDAGKPSSNEDCVTYKDNGHCVFLETIKTPMYDAQGTLIGVLGIGRDITERKRYEESLRQANSKLNILSSITRHDIKNQLTALSGHLALLEKNGMPASFEGHLRKAEAAAERISAMIQFTKEYEDIGVHIPSRQNIRKLIDACIKEVHLGHIRIVNDVPPMIEMFADPLIVKVFHNLIDNAMRHGGKTTTIRWFVEEIEGMPSIVCEDDGVGIPVDMKESIFTRCSGRDHGFGLFLSREILAINAAKIIEVGEPGKGAKFIISMPPCEPGDRASRPASN